MGRGLSDLQKDILLIALRNHIAEGRKLPGWEVCVLNATDRQAELESFCEPRPCMRVVLNGTERDLNARTIQADNEQEIGIGEEWLTTNGFTFEPRTWWIGVPLDAPRRTLYSLIMPYTSRQEGADLYAYEVLSQHFGFEVACAIDGSWRGGDRRALLNGGHVFERKKIGRARYDAAQASLARAMKRLEQRGLMLVGWSGGYHLTGKGLAMAQELSVKTDANVPKS
jgi:hypothetical protein